MTFSQLNALFRLYSTGRKQWLRSPRGITLDTYSTILAKAPDTVLAKLDAPLGNLAPSLPSHPLLLDPEHPGAAFGNE